MHMHVRLHAGVSKVNTTEQICEVRLIHKRNRYVSTSHVLVER